MEMFLLRPSDYDRLYNCSSIATSAAAPTTAQRQQHYSLGAFYLGVGALLFALYVPCLAAIWRHRVHSCYKLMFAMGVLDLPGVLVAGVLTGWWMLRGTMFCDAPAVNYFFGCFGDALWAAETTVEAMLALNRCVKMCSDSLGRFLYSGEKTWVWVAGAIVVGLYYFFFVPPALMCALYATWMVNPLAGFNDTVDETFVQVLIISVVNVVEYETYLYMQLNPEGVTEFMIFIGQFFWILLHGIPPVIYIAMNPTIRRDCQDIIVRKVFRYNPNTNNNVSWKPTNPLFLPPTTRVSMRE